MREASSRVEIMCTMTLRFITGSGSESVKLNYNYEGSFGESGTEIVALAFHIIAAGRSLVLVLILALRSGYEN